MAQDPESKTLDIGRTGQISGVPEFLKEDIMYQPLPHSRPQTPYAATGSNPGAHDSEGNPYTFAQVRPKKDIGEVGVDPEVHGMVKANNMISPISNWRPDAPYAHNGSAEKGWGTTVVPGEVAKYAQRERPQKTKDIGEGGIDPEVHGMASANNMVSPISNWRPGTPYDYNGSADGAHCSAGECPDIP